MNKIIQSLILRNSQSAGHWQLLAGVWSIEVGSFSLITSGQMTLSGYARTKIILYSILIVLFAITIGLRVRNDIKQK